MDKRTLLMGAAGAGMLLLGVRTGCAGQAGEVSGVLALLFDWWIRCCSAAWDVWACNLKQRLLLDL